MPSPIARLIDHTALKPDTTREQIRRLCAEAREHGFATVCVNSAWVPECAALLAGSDVVVCTVVGFPLGASLAAAKAYEAEIAVEDGAEEIDMVINIGALKGGDLAAVREDIAEVRRAVPSAILKVIIETSLLTDAEKVTACTIAAKCGADYVKTSTGFGGGGATVADIELMRRTVGTQMGVKASGGVRTLAEAEAMIAAGATRIGTSHGVTMVTAN